MTEIESFANLFVTQAWNIFRDYLENLIIHMEDKNIPIEKQKRILSSVNDFILEFLEEQGQDQVSIQLSQVLIKEIGTPKEIITTLDLSKLSVKDESKKIAPSYTRKATLGGVIIEKSIIVIFIFSQFFLSILIQFIDPISVAIDNNWQFILISIFFNPQVVLMSIFIALIVELVIFSGLKNKKSNSLKSTMKRMIWRIEMSNVGSIIYLSFFIFFIVGISDIMLEFIITYPDDLRDFSSSTQPFIVLTPLAIMLGFILYLWNYSYRPKDHTYQSLLNKYRYLRVYDDKRLIRFSKAFFGLWLAVPVCIMVFIFILHFIYGSSQIYFNLSRGITYILLGLAGVYFVFHCLKDIYFTSWRYIQRSTREEREKIMVNHYKNPESYKINLTLVHPYDLLVGFVTILTFITTYSILDISSYFADNVISNSTMVSILVFWAVLTILYLMMAILMYRLVDKVPDNQKTFKRYHIILTGIFCAYWGIALLKNLNTVFKFPSAVEQGLLVLFFVTFIPYVIIVGTFLFIMPFRPLVGSKNNNASSIPIMLSFGYIFVLAPILYEQVGYNPIYVIGIAGIIPLFLLTVGFYLLARKYPYIMHQG